MSNITTKPGKQATRGEKTIISENVETLLFYRNVSILCVLIPVIIQMCLFYDTLSTTFYAMNSIATAVLWCSYKFMCFMANVKRGPTGEVLDCGTDLNMTNGMAEHCKDLSILTWIVLISSMFSEWLWLALLLAPLRALYMFWVHVAAPWIFAPPPDEEEISEKKQRRMERKQMKYKRA